MEVVADQVKTMVGPEVNLVLVWDAAPVTMASVNLEYWLYPRLIAQRQAGEPSTNARECAIDWHSASDVTVRCPGSTWQYRQFPRDAR